MYHHYHALSVLNNPVKQSLPFWWTSRQKDHRQSQPRMNWTENWMKGLGNLLELKKNYAPTNSAVYWESQNHNLPSNKANPLANPIVKGLGSTRINKQSNQKNACESWNANRCEPLYMLQFFSTKKKGIYFICIYHICQCHFLILFAACAAYLPFSWDFPDWTQRRTSRLLHSLDFQQK